MPITSGAIRKLRSDKRKTKINLQVKLGLKAAVAKMRKKPTARNLQAVFIKADRAAKNRVVHPNKAARLKSRLSRLVKKK